MECSGTGGGSASCTSMTYNSTTNRLNSVGMQVVQYDAAGNLLNTGSGSETYSVSVRWTQDTYCDGSHS